MGSTLSSSSRVVSGVPQGRVLGPVLFILFINDVTDCISHSATVKLFADYLKLYSEISCPLQFNIIQHNLNKIFNWSVIWQLPISSPKCSTLHLGTLPANKYHINDFSICNSSFVKESCLIATSNLFIIFRILCLEQVSALISSSAASFLAILTILLRHSSHMFVLFWSMPLLFGHPLSTCI